MIVAAKAIAAPSTEAATMRGRDQLIMRPFAEANGALSVRLAVKFPTRRATQP